MKKLFYLIFIFVIDFNLTKAQIVYVDVNPDSCTCLNIPPSPTPSTYSLSSFWDLDRNGINDFKIYVEISGSVDCMHESYITSLFSLDSSKVIVNSSGILKLNAGDTIKAQSNWGAISQLEYFNGFTGWTGNWWIDTAGFVGIKFYSGLMLYYGWINLIADATCNTARVVVKDYAYSTWPIAAGEGEPTSIKGYKINQIYQIYPNPSNGNFLIETNSTDKQTLQVFDVNGKLVLTQIISGKTNIDASSLTEGVYSLSLQNSNSVVNKCLVIVR